MFIMQSTIYFFLNNISPWKSNTNLKKKKFDNGEIMEVRYMYETNF